MPQKEKDAHSNLQSLPQAAHSSYAAATVPTLAQTAIHTPADGLTAGIVSVDVAGFKVPAYRAMPAGGSALPVIMVLSEIFGVHEYIADTVRRFARLGYLAIAPDLFVRQGGASSYSDIPTLMAQVISKVPDEQVRRDLAAVAQWAQANGGDTDKLGITGFCWGGRQSWLFAAQHPKVKAGVVWYGRLVGEVNPLTPYHPVDLVGQLRAPVLGLYGGADASIGPESIETMKAALAQAATGGNRAAADSRFVIYPQAPHAFHADYRPSYRKEAAEDGWKRALSWFKQYGVA